VNGAEGVSALAGFHPFAENHRYDCGWPLAEGFQTPDRDPSEYRKRTIGRAIFCVKCDAGPR
jgi:hypothetical protein